MGSEEGGKFAKMEKEELEKGRELSEAKASFQGNLDVGLVGVFFPNPNPCDSGLWF